MKLPPDVARRLFLTKKLPRIAAFAILTAILLILYFGFPQITQYWPPVNRRVSLFATLIVIGLVTGVPLRFFKKGWEGEITEIEMRGQWESYTRLIFFPNYRTTAVRLTIKTPKGDFDFVEANNDRTLRRLKKNALERFEVGDYVYQSPWTHYTLLGKKSGPEDMTRCMYCGHLTPSHKPTCSQCGLTLIHLTPPVREEQIKEEGSCHE